jgi:hypothetical protein
MGDHPGPDELPRADLVPVAGAPPSVAGSRTNSEQDVTVIGAS